MPLLHYFNPGHETAVLNGSPYYMPPANVVMMQRDLAFLPAWYASPEDWVITSQAVSATFRESLFSRFGAFAHSFTLEEIVAQSASLPEMVACPWGLSPQSIRIYEQLKEDTTWQLLSVPPYDETYGRLCGRQTAALCLRSLLSVLPQEDKRLIPRFRSSLEEIETILRSEKEKFVIKAPYSSSGRGLLWVAGALGETDKQWIAGVLKKQGTVSIERALRNRQDFAMEFYSDGEGNITYEGLSLFDTGTQGTYKGNFLMSQPEIKKRLSTFIDVEVLEEVKESLTYTLQDIVGYLYRGYLGVDMMIYDAPDGQSFRIHPCVEINLRYTMGLVALKLHQRFVAEERQGSFHIEYYASAGRALERQVALEKDFPFVVESGRIVKGYQPLCPVTKESRYLAYMLIHPV